MRLSCVRLHSQKQSAHWAVDETAQVVPCWLGSWLKCNFWPVFNQPTLFDIDRKVTGVMKYSGVSYFFWECECRCLSMLILVWCREEKNGLVSGNAPFLGPYNNPHIFSLIKAHAKGVYQHGVIPNSVSTKCGYTEGLIQRWSDVWHSA